MNAYEQKIEDKKERLLAAADRAEENSTQAYNLSDMSEGASGISFGQPILVGHHSEGRHRAAIKRADNAMRKSVSESKRADQLRSKAAAVGTGGISSDDPQATEKLQTKLAEAKKNQAFMKGANKVLRMKNKTNAELATELRKIPGGENCIEDHIISMLKPDFCGRVGFASYQMTNNNANIKRMEKRIQALQVQDKAETKEYSIAGICDVIENTDENRLQVIFSGKPSSEIRKALKSHGFRWAPSQNAWQRQLTNNARYSMRLLSEKLQSIHA